MHIKYIIKYLGLFVMVLILMSCKKMPKEGDKVHVVSKIHLVGNEPFTKIMILIENRPVYLEVSDNLKDFFIRKQGNEVVINGIFKVKNDQYFIHVSSVIPD